MEILTYNYFNKIELPNFDIDNNQNINIIKSFNYFHELMSNANIKYVLTGSLGRSILTKKYYRTWGDLDILIDISKKDFFTKLENSFSFNKSDWILHEIIYNETVPHQIRNFIIKDVKNSIFIDIEIVNSLNNKVFIFLQNLISKRDLLINKNYYQIKIKNNIINIGFDYFYQSYSKNKPFINFGIS